MSQSLNILNNPGNPMTTILLQEQSPLSLLAPRWEKAKEETYEMWLNVVLFLKATVKII